jgi:hypothetical protein
MSLLNSVIERELKPGTYWTTIHYYKERNPKGRQPYIEVRMNIDGLEITDRWYANRIPYIMHCIRHQFRADFFDYTLSQLLQLAHDHEIVVHISYDGYYGRQIDYKD